MGCIASAGNTFCQDLYWRLQQSTTGQVVWRFIKPFIVGELFYAPANDVTDHIMLSVSTGSTRA